MLDYLALSKLLIGEHVISRLWFKVSFGSERTEGDIIIQSVLERSLRLGYLLLHKGVIQIRGSRKYLDPRLFDPAFRVLWLYRGPRYKSLQGAIKTPQRLRIGTF